MRKATVVLIVAVFTIPYLCGANQQDLTKPISQFIDGFNNGDMKTANAAYVSGDVAIVDEFPPHLWMGPHAVQEWAADFEKLGKADNDTDASVKYGAPTRTEVKDGVAYVVIPTVFNFRKSGQAMTEKGQMTFVLRQESGAWKIASWTWTGEAAHAMK